MMIGSTTRQLPPVQLQGAQRVCLAPLAPQTPLTPLTPYSLRSCERAPSNPFRTISCRRYPMKLEKTFLLYSCEIRRAVPAVKMVFMPALLDAIDIKRKMYFEFEGAPYYCMDVDVSTPTARGGQTLVRFKMRNLLTRAVFDKTFKAGEKFKEPDLETVEASYLYSDSEGSYFLDQESFDTIQLSPDKIGDALELMIEGAIIKIDKFNGNPIGLQLPEKVELAVTYTEPGVRGDTARGDVTKPARLETGLEIKVPFFIKEGEKVKVFTETREFAGRA
jgi:elongation factor P